jgi:hypothetical protein
LLSPAITLRNRETATDVFKIRRADYFYTAIQNQPGEGYKLLSQLADLGVNLLAFTEVPVGPTRTQLTLFPNNNGNLTSAAKKAGLQLDGPHPALLVNGDDELGALAEIREKLYDADVNVYASTGVTDGEGSYGYVMYVKGDEIDRAARILEV